MLEQLAQYGALGSMLAITVGYIYVQDKRHKEERREWRQESLMMHKETNGVIKENTTAYNSNTRALAELSTLIKQK